MLYDVDVCSFYLFRPPFLKLPTQTVGFAAGKKYDKCAGQVAEWCLDWTRKLSMWSWLPIGPKRGSSATEGEVFEGCFYPLH